MKRIVLIGVLLCTPILSFAGDAYAESLRKWHTDQAESIRNDPRFNDVAVLTARINPHAVNPETPKSHKPPPVTNQFLEECESLTSNRQMCYELWVERQK